jgi:hypothetical protein
MVMRSYGCKVDRLVIDIYIAAHADQSSYRRMVSALNRAIMASCLV